MVDFKLFCLDVTHRGISEALDFSDFTLHGHLVLFNALTPAFFDDQVLLVDKEAYQKERRREKLHVAKNAHDKLILVRYVGLIEVGPIRSQDFLVTILPYDDEGDCYG